MDDNDAYEALSSNIQLIDVDRGTTLFSEGEEGDLFYIIIQGEAEVLKASQLVVEYEGESARKPKKPRDMEEKVTLAAIIPILAELRKPDATIV